MRIVIDYHNTPMTETIGGKTCRFRSKGEYNLALYLQFCKEKGIIEDWAHEQTKFTFKDETRGAKEWLVDFDVLNEDGTFEYWEWKGWLTGKDVTKFQRVAKYRPEVKVILVMSGKAKKDQNRLRQIAKYAHRIVYANDLFKPVRGLVKFV